MYTYHITERLTNVITEHNSLLMPTSLFDDSVLLIAVHKSIVDWYRVRMADEGGAFANVTVKYPGNALKAILDMYPALRAITKGKTLATDDALTLALVEILAALPPVKKGEDDPYERLRSYLGGSGNDIRVAQFARTLAVRFHFYMMNNELMIRSWEEGVPYFTDNKDERFQMALWREVFLRNDHIISFERLCHAFEALNDQPDNAPARVCVLGSPFLSSIFLRFLGRLSRDIDVHHFISAPAFAASDTFPQHPLSRQWALPLYGQMRRMRERGFTQGNAHAPSPVQTETLLARVQDAILRDAPSAERVPFAKDDESVIVAACTGKRREVEVLHNRLLSLLQQDPSLMLTDIIVLAPDIAEYVLFITSVFDGSDTFIPYTIVNAKGVKESAYLSGVMALLSLAGAEFTRKEVFTLFANPCFRARFSFDEDAVERFLYHVEQMNVRVGMDEEHKAQKGFLANAHNTFQGGFRRMFLGTFLYDMEEERVFPDEKCEGGREQTIPYTIADSGEAHDAGMFAELAFSLFEDLFDLVSWRAPLREWVDYIEVVAETYLAPRAVSDDDARDVRVFERACAKIRALAEASETAFSFIAFRSLIENEFDTAVAIRHAGGRGVVFSDFKNMRATPAKCIMILGMDEGAIPGTDYRTGFDLNTNATESDPLYKAIEEEHADESKSTLFDILAPGKRATDRFLFFETLLAAEKTLYLSYQGRDQVNDIALEPSSLVKELFDYINSVADFAGKSAERALVIRHPLHGHAHAYFTGEDARLFSYNRVHYENALALQRAQQEEESESQAIVSDDDVVVFTTDEFLLFAENPIKAFYRFVLQIGIYEEEDLADCETERVDLPFFTGYAYYTSRLLGEGEETDAWLSYAHMRGEVTETALSYPDRKSAKETAGALEQVREEHDLATALSKPKTVLFAGESEGDDLYPEIALSVDTTNVLISGRLANVSITGDTLYEVFYSPSSSVSCYRFFRAYARFLLLAASGVVETLNVVQALGKTGKSKAGTMTISIEDARAQLVALARMVLHARECPRVYYPDVFKAMHAYVLGKKSGITYETETLPDDEAEALEEKVRGVFAAFLDDMEGGYSPSAIARCPYIAHAFKHAPPAFDPPSLFATLKTVYRAFFEMLPA